MRKLSHLSFREYIGRPLVIDGLLSHETIERLANHLAADPASGLTSEQAARVPDCWDYEANASLVWPRVDHDEGVVLTFLCPCRVDEDGAVDIESGYDLYGSYGLAVNYPASAGALDCKLVAKEEWHDLPEGLKDLTRWMEESSDVAPGVRAARADERLDPWRDRNYPDIAEALLFTRPDVDPAPLWVRLERPAVELAGTQRPHWLATVAQVPEGGCAAQTGDDVLVGIARNEMGMALGLYALLKEKLTEDDYDPDYDRANGGQLSLEIGARYYADAMEISDGADTSDADRERRLDSFRQAEKFYRISADLGNVQAICNLGYVYSLGRLGESDQGLAAHLFKKAADLGHAEAAYKYGDQLRSGNGVERDREQAYFYYEMAYKRAQTDGEHPAIWGSAALRLADCCERGIGCKKNLDRARDLYLEAESGLEQVVQDEPWYVEPLAQARAGSTRLASV